MIRLLLVDDEELVRSGLRMILQSSGDVEVVAEAADGAQAVEQVRRHRPDVVLMDIRMPTLDGLAATRELTALPDPPKIIVLTTFELDEYVHTALRHGAVGHLHGRHPALGQGELEAPPRGQPLPLGEPRAGDADHQQQHQGRQQPEDVADRDDHGQLRERHHHEGEDQDRHHTPRMAYWDSQGESAGRPRSRSRDRGKSGLHRAGCWPTASRGDPQDSATESKPPPASPGPYGPVAPVVRVKGCGKSAPAAG